MRTGIFNSLRDWALLLGFCVVVGVGAAVLSSLGYEVFERVPFVVAGGVIGFCFGNLLVYTLGRRWRTVVILIALWVSSLLLYFVLPYEWLFVGSGEGLSGTDKAPDYWLVQGAATGLVISAGLVGALLSQGEMTPGEIRKRKRDSRRSLLLLGGTVMGVFMLLFLVYVFLEYLLAPIVRFFL